ncbi:MULTISPECIES: hypothetical protein [Haloferacaceae]|uniref:DUF4229 domain-containing protein n=1 Tax=Halorubrum glutamatedens TaxID=2707018 RepID=A0ABD5QS09_9EURY|nr:hypothetical protein [Halobellus captivus]
MVHDPLSPSEALRTRSGAVLGTVSLLVFIYSLLIVGQVLLGVIVVVGLSIGPYLSYRLFAVLDSVADGAQRIADAKEREVGEESADRGARDDRDATDREASESTGSTRLTERER